MISEKGRPGGGRRIITVLLAVACVAAAGALCFDVVKRARERLAGERELEAALRLAEPLSVLDELGDCVLATPAVGERVLLIGLAPNGRAWRMVRWLEDGVVVEQVRAGRVESVRRLRAARPAREVELYRTGERLDLYFGGRAVRLGLPDGWGWRLVSWLAPGGARVWRMTTLRSQVKRDEFMREQFGASDGWTVERGQWRIAIQGGGQGRSANAFVLDGQAAEGESGAVRTGWQADANYTAEVSALADSASASYWVEAGNAEGARAAFGWNGAEGCWELVWQPAGGEPRVLMRRGFRLPPGNWARVGLRLASPFEVVPLLDGVALGEHSTAEPIFGQVRLRVAGGAVHFDDFSMLGREVPAEPFTPVFVKSRAFVNKPIEAAKDADFVKWVHDTLCCESVSLAVGAQSYPGLRYTVPLYGDFVYEGTPADARRLLVRLEDDEGKQQDFTFQLSDGQWRLEPGRQEVASGEAALDGPAQAKLCLSYSGGVLYQQSSERRPLARLEAAGPLCLSVCAFGAGVSPEQHVVRSGTLWDEFFETAPVGWTWWSGEFGMQYRWACQPYWDWMGGWSRGLAACFSRAAYEGDQTIEYYVSLKDLIAGHASRRYVRRDLNFSFCTDGRSLASGYSLLFSGFGGRRTCLMKGDQVLASTEQVTLPPDTGDESDVHWRWWHVRVEKRGARIRVFIDERQVFDFMDQEPLSGGHLAFWTVGNGFLLARVRVAAERSSCQSQRFWGEPSIEGGSWQAMDAGALCLSRSDGWTRVVNRAGGGMFAVRWAGGPVDLTKTPILALPFEAGPDARVSLHLQVSGNAFLVPITAPVEETPAVLSPAWLALPAQVAFYLPTVQPQIPPDRILDGASVRQGEIRIDLLGALGGRAGAAPVLECLVIGNTSNKGYLLAGFGGNGPAAEYLLGEPRWLASMPEGD